VPGGDAPVLTKVTKGFSSIMEISPFGWRAGGGWFQPDHCFGEALEIWWRRSTGLTPKHRRSCCNADCGDPPCGTGKRSLQFPGTGAHCEKALGRPLGGSKMESPFQDYGDSKLRPSKDTAPELVRESRWATARCRSHEKFFL